MPVPYTASSTVPGQVDPPASASWAAGLSPGPGFRLPDEAGDVVWFGWPGLADPCGRAVCGEAAKAFAAGGSPAVSSAPPRAVPGGVLAPAAGNDGRRRARNPAGSRAGNRGAKRNAYRASFMRRRVRPATRKYSSGMAGTTDPAAPAEVRMRPGTR